MAHVLDAAVAERLPASVTVLDIPNVAEFYPVIAAAAGIWDIIDDPTFCNYQWWKRSRGATNEADFSTSVDPSESGSLSIVSLAVRPNRDIQQVRGLVHPNGYDFSRLAQALLISREVLGRKLGGEVTKIGMVAMLPGGRTREHRDELPARKTTQDSMTVVEARTFVVTDERGQVHAIPQPIGRDVELKHASRAEKHNRRKTNRHRVINGGAPSLSITAAIRH